MRSGAMKVGVCMAVQNYRRRMTGEPDTGHSQVPAKPAAAPVGLRVGRSRKYARSGGTEQILENNVMSSDWEVYRIVLEVRCIIEEMFIIWLILLIK